MGFITLQSVSGAAGPLIAVLALLLPSLTAAYVARLRQTVLLRRDETDRQVRMAEQANRTYELSLHEKELDVQERNANLAALFLEVARLDLEVRQAELGHGREVPLAAE